jgi:two-component system, LuxR family, sensor kinase FixL
VRLPSAELIPFPAFVADGDGVLRSVNTRWRNLLAQGVGDRWPDSFLAASMPDPDFRLPARHEAEPPRIRTRVRTGEMRWFEVHCQKLIDSENDPEEIFGIFIDVTDQTRREAEILAILRTAVDGIILMDEQGCIEVMNEAAERLFGYTQSELAGQPVDVLMPEPYRSSHGHYLRNYLLTGKARIIGIGRELEASTRDGRRIPIHLSVSEIRLEGTRRFTGFVRDLSDQRATLEVLAEQRERLAHVGRLSTMGEMTASIAHEINQPLTAISMYAQSGLKLLQRHAPDLAKLASALDKLNTQCLRAGAIIERIQRFTRAQESQREPVVINSLLTDLVKLAEGDARLHDLELEFALEDGLPTLMADPIQIQQVALNLIRNAIDAMNEIGCANGRTIRITTQLLPDGRIEVAVTDQGPGVAEDQSDLLFTPFHTTKKEGMGMGLSICRTIIAEHGGVLGFRNHTGTACGATFFFTLPTESIDHG